MAQDGVQWSDLALAVPYQTGRYLDSYIVAVRSDWVVHSKLGRTVYAKNIMDQDVPAKGFRSVPASDPAPT